MFIVFYIYWVYAYIYDVYIDNVYITSYNIIKIRDINK